MGQLKISWGIWAAIGLALVALIFACSTDRTTKPTADAPPETHLFLFFSDTLQLPGETTSMQVLHWYGDDPDGEVVGYEYKWNYDTAWTFTTDVSDTFFVPIRVPLDTFTFIIRAIDDAGLRDETPAKLSLPILNSPPILTFPTSFMQQYSHVTYSCFPYYSIGWSGYDPDGNSTITGYYWSLVDSSFPVPIDSIHNGHRYWNQEALNAMNWEYLDSLQSYLVLDSTRLHPGSYRFFMRCRDVAGAYSEPILYPDTDGVWNIMPFVGSVLFVNADRAVPTAFDTVVTSSLNAIYGLENYSKWDVRDRISYFSRDIEGTLKYFPIVIWQGGSAPRFADASNEITRYIRDFGGHLIAFSTQRYVGDTANYPFLPVDTFTTATIGRSYTLARVNRPDSATNGYPDTLSSRVTGYPNYPISRSSGFRPGQPSGLMPGTVQALYTQRADFIPGQIDTVAARYMEGGRTKVVYFSMELYLCSARFGELLRYVLLQEFQNARY